MYPNTELEIPFISLKSSVEIDAEVHDMFMVYAELHDTFPVHSISLQFRTLMLALFALNNALHETLQSGSIVKDCVTSRLPTMSFLSPVRFLDDRELNPSCAISIV
jgi:hypothetical protein